MPVLTLHFPKELMDEEFLEDLLLHVNKKAEDQARFKRRDDWMRAVLRGYLVNSLDSLSRWKATKILPTVTGGMISVPILTFWEGDPDGLDDGAEGERVNLLVGNLQYTLFKKAVAWENTYQREILKSVVEHKNVAALARFIIINAMLTVQTKIDEERLLEEEKALQEEPQGEDPDNR